MQGLGQILAEIGEAVPWPVLVLALVAFVLLAGPGYLHSVRLRQIRERVRRRVRADAETRAVLADEAIRFAGANPDRLALLAREASKRGQPDLYQRARTGLEATGDRRTLAQLDKEIRRPAPAERSPTEAAAFIAGLIEDGLLDMARTHFAEAMSANPAHPALLALRDHLVRQDEEAAP